MDINQCSFEHLQFSSLFNTYVQNFKSLDEFYEYDPFSGSDLENRLKDLNQPSDMHAVADALRAYHKDLGIRERQEDQLSKLTQKGARVVVTGQQIGIYGGPLFTIYKTVTTILKAKIIEEEHGIPVVPVFWMADEDHDFEEIAWSGVLGRDDFKKIELAQGGSGSPVSTERINGSFSDFFKEYWDEQFDTDFTDRLQNKLKEYYASDELFVNAFARLINDLFSKHGVLIAGSQHPAIKALLKEPIKRSVERSSDLYDAIEKASTSLEKTYHRQVQNGDTNLFYFDSKGSREKIHIEENNFTAADKVWSKDELIEEIGQSPDKFSPNVFLRPVIQDVLFPTIGYVAGPGELSYYGQMKHFYGVFDMKMPIIYPRLSATILESAIDRILDKLPFELWDFNQRIEDLESEYLKRADTPDIEAIFNNWKKGITEQTSSPREQIKKIDPTLDGTVGKTEAHFLTELDKLKGRVYRSVKEQEKTQISRIEKIKVNLFPDGGLQERSLSPVYIMNKYGTDIWDLLIDKLGEDDLDLTKHHIIHL